MSDPATPAPRRRDEPPVLLVRWYDVTKWFLERVDGFPKNQRFIFGQRLVDAAIDILDLLVEAAYRKEKREVLVRTNLRLERLRWMVRLAGERGAVHRSACSARPSARPSRCVP